MDQSLILEIYFKKNNTNDEGRKQAFKYYYYRKIIL